MSVKNEAIKRIERAQRLNKISFEDSTFDAQSISDILNFSVQDLIHGDIPNQRLHVDHEKHTSSDKLRRGSIYPHKMVAMNKEKSLDFA